MAIAAGKKEVWAGGREGPKDERRRFFGLVSDAGGGRGLPTCPSLGLLFRRLFVVAGAAPSPSSCNLRRPPSLPPLPSRMPKPTHSPLAVAEAVPPWAFRPAKDRDSGRVRERPGTLKLRLWGGGTVPPHFYCIIEGGAGKR